MTTGIVAEIAIDVAAVEDTDPAELDFVLQDFIPGDAIRLLADHKTATWRLWFELPRHEITITSDGAIFVDGINEKITA